MSDTNFTENGADQEIKSKTQLKQESLAIQKLGETLVDLGAASLAKIPMDDELADAVELARRINKKKDGYRRQLQLIGKLMRHRDTQPIQLALDQLQMAHRQQTKQFHHVEEARDKVLLGDKHIEALLNEHPELDRQKLRQYARQAKKQQELNKPPKAARELFQYLKENL
ncbi:ribosome biogenesis factor YjgA [Aliiglaciecola lipolytica]|uniref:Dual-action ribosomal maturation protein DarP n=1 Tax=Aliiglaciecola lipolytica E3 TaxID=1127673 RepID=K6Y6B1_9ALTE|nr:ribosome biogenesis factor YjgA [Aliiglaciecola lipolytica]GAC13767.1 ribosome-associated protein [Aliiglaciecola lipolytica E3]